MGDLILTGCTQVYSLIPALIVAYIVLDFLGSFFFGK